LSDSYPFQELIQQKQQHEDQMKVIFSNFKKRYGLDALVDLNDNKGQDGQPKEKFENLASHLLISLHYLESF